MIVQFLLELDRFVFTAINSLPHPIAMDTLAMVLSGISSYGFVWIFFGGLLLIREEIRDHRFIGRLGATIALSFGLSELLLKPIIGRLRPIFIAGTTVVVPIAGQYSFPSSHAVVAFASARVLAQKEPAIGTFMYILAGCVGLSRIYLGHHYPLDVVFGSVLGLLIGEFVVFIARFFSPKKQSGKTSRGRV